MRKWIDSIRETFDHPHLRGEDEWFRWLHGVVWFNVDEARRKIASGEVKASPHTVETRKMYALLGFDEDEFGSEDFRDDMEAGRGFDMFSAVQQRSNMKGMPDDKLNEPALIAMLDGVALMKQLGMKADHGVSKPAPVLIDGNHRVARCFLEGKPTINVLVIPHDEVLKFAYHNEQPVLKR